MAHARIADLAAEGKLPQVPQVGRCEPLPVLVSASGVHHQRRLIGQLERLELAVRAGIDRREVGTVVCIWKQNKINNASYNRNCTFFSLVGLVVVCGLLCGLPRHGVYAVRVAFPIMVNDCYTFTHVAKLLNGSSVRYPVANGEAGHRCAWRTDIDKGIRQK